MTMRIQQSDTPSPRQLVLPLDDFSGQAHGIPRPRRVFCNRNLKMSNIAWVGFDMVYTLAIYDQAAMDRLSIDATVAKLIARGYPELLLGSTSTQVAQHSSRPVTIVPTA